MHIERGQRLAVRDKPIHAGQPAEQPSEGGLAQKKNRAATFLDQRQIANELQSVAETLFRIHQDGFALQRRAIPARLLIRGANHAGLFPAQFVIRPAAGEIALQQTQAGTVPEGHLVAAVERKRLRLARGRLGDAPLRGEFIGQIAVSIGEGRIAAQGLAKAFARFGQPALFNQRNSQIIVRFGVTGLVM